ncbi:hypothetical protein ABVT39_024265 [Epinephelus coioides]
MQTYDEGGPQLADPEVEIITPEVGIPLARSKENPTKLSVNAAAEKCENPQPFPSRAEDSDLKQPFILNMNPLVTSDVPFVGDTSELFCKSVLTMTTSLTVQPYCMLIKADTDTSAPEWCTHKTGL